LLLMQAPLTEHVYTGDEQRWTTQGNSNQFKPIRNARRKNRAIGQITVYWFTARRIQYP
jgi:hypothetical protein